MSYNKSNYTIEERNRTVQSLETSENKIFPMRHRWTVHKSHFKTSYNGCKLTDHLIKFHKGEEPQNFLKVVILQEASSLEELLELEIKWTRKLFCYHPSGLNEREERTLQSFQ